MSVSRFIRDHGSYADRCIKAIREMGGDPKKLVAVAKASIEYNQCSTPNNWDVLATALHAYESSLAPEESIAPETLHESEDVKPEGHAMLDEALEMTGRIAQIQDVPIGKPSNFEERISALEVRRDKPSGYWQVYDPATRSVSWYSGPDPLQAAKDAVCRIVDGHFTRCSMVLWKEGKFDMTELSNAVRAWRAIEGGGS